MHVVSDLTAELSDARLVVQAMRFGHNFSAETLLDKSVDVAPLNSTLAHVIDFANG